MPNFEQMPPVEGQEKKEKRKTSLKTAMKVFAAMTMAAVSSNAESGDDNLDELLKVPGADNVELSIKGSVKDLEEGFKDIQGLAAKELERQGFTQEEIDETMKAPAQADSQTFQEGA